MTADGDGPGDAAFGEPTRDEILDSAPEAVAMRRARAARAAKSSAPPAPETRPTSRRRLVVGGLLGALAALRVAERALRVGRRP